MSRNKVIACVVSPGDKSMICPKNIDMLMDYINLNIYEGEASKVYLSATSKPPGFHIDLLILHGGVDIIPIGMERHFMSKKYPWIPITDFSPVLPGIENGMCNPHLTYFDRNILPELIQRGTKVFGICRGFQVLNDLFGGTLHQNIDNHASEYHGIIHTLEMPKTKSPISNVTIKGDEKSLIKYTVNSRHHQAIDLLGIGIKPIGWSAKESKIGTTLERPFFVEELIHELFPIIGVQYHPEDMIQNSLMLNRKSRVSELGNYLSALDRIIELLKSI